MNVPHGNTILITFDSFVDTDYGLIMLIKEKYNNPDIIYKSVLDAGDAFIINALANREDEDPLTIILQDKYIENRYKLRSEFIEKEYKDIVRLSRTNDIINLIEMMYISNTIEITILCKDELESNKVNELLSKQKPNIIIEQDLSKIKIDKYDSIFIKNYKDIISFKGLMGKNIYVLDYKFNTELDPTGKKRPLVFVDGLIGDKNYTNLISPYDLSKIKIYG